MHYYSDERILERIMVAGKRMNRKICQSASKFCLVLLLIKIWVAFPVIYPQIMMRIWAYKYVLRLELHDGIH